MNPLEKLTEQFRQFPGIGPRQARRFVYFLLRSDTKYANDLIQLIRDVREHVRLCEESYCYFYSENPDEKLSPIARNANRNTELLMVVEKDSDLESIERSGTYNGRYFVLGGTVPILEKEPSKRIRSKKLIALVSKKAREGLKEIILATSANPDGENTAEYVSDILEPLISEHKIKLSLLGRGLSTGTELEYSDNETIKNALENRH